MKPGVKSRNTRNRIDGDRKAIIVRLAPPIHEALSRRAGDEKRSVNAHVEYLIERDLEAAA